MIIKLSFIMFFVAFSSIGLLYKLANASIDDKEYPSNIQETFVTIILLVSFVVASFAGICLL